MSTIYETLKKDHDRHCELLATIADTQGDSETRRKAWDSFYHDVSAHAAAEEETFYSKLIADEDGQPEARHSVAEHKEIDDMLEELNEIDFSSPAWLPKFKESNLWILTHKDLTRSKRIRLATDFFYEELKKSIMLMLTDSHC